MTDIEKIEKVKEVIRNWAQSNEHDGCWMAVQIQEILDFDAFEGIDDEA